MMEKDPDDPLKKETKRKLNETVNFVEGGPLKAQSKEVSPKLDCPDPEFVDLTAEESAAFIKDVEAAEVMLQKNRWIEEKKNDIVWVENTLIEFATECDELVNKKWDDEHGIPKNPKQCWDPSPNDEKMWDKKLQKNVPKPILFKLGELKEECVNQKALYIFRIKQQQRFAPDGTITKDQYLPGASVPDYVLHGPSESGDTKLTHADQVYAVFDLKCPCPPVKGKPGTWKTGQEEKYLELFKVDPVMIYPGKQKVEKK